MDKNIEIFGSYKGPTGYDTVVREIVKRLSGYGFNINLIDFSQWSGKTIDYDKNFDDFNHNEHSDLRINFCLPEQVILNPLVFNINYSMLECDRISPEWAQYSKQIDLTIVPTESSRMAWLEAGVPSYKIKKCPLGVDIPVINHDDTLSFIPEIAQHPIRFLNIHELGPRKNTLGLLHSWILGTRDRKDEMCLILKLSDYTSGRIKKFFEDVYELYRSLGVKSNEHAQVFYSFKTLHSTDILKLMNIATHYISASFGEGWDLNAIGMASLGKSLILPRHTSYIEWGREDLVNYIDCNKIPAYAEGGLTKVYNGSNWWSPNIEQLANEISISENVGHQTELSNFVQSNYSWEKCVSNLSKLLKDAWYVDSSSNHGLSKIECKPRLLMWTPTIGKPCGIAEYSTSLVEGLEKCFPDMVVHLGGKRSSFVNDMLFDKYNDIVLEHLQMEYQFWSPARLKIIGRQCHRRGIKLFVTMHTVGVGEVVEPYHNVLKKYADYIIVHSESAALQLEHQGFEKDKICILPMFVPTINKNEIDVQLLPDDKFKFGFFGFLYPHKGIISLLEAFNSLKQKNKNVFLLLCASKHDNDNSGNIEKIYQYIQDHKWEANVDYAWFSEYLSDDKVLAYLKQCDSIVLPYEEYGSYGSSAAVNMCALAEKPMILSDVCWFNHLPENIKIKYDNKDKLEDIMNFVMNTDQIREDLTKNISEWIKKYTVNNSVTEHIMLYKKAIPWLLKKI